MGIQFPLNNEHPLYNLKEEINKLVCRARDITFRASMLDSIHSLRICQEAIQLIGPPFGEQNPFDFPHDQEYYCKLFRAVCNHRTDRLEQNDDQVEDQLLATLNELYTHIYPQNAALDYSNMSAILSELANECVQNFNEHVSRNLQPIFCRLFRLDIAENYRYLHLTDDEDAIRKISLHCFKLLGNMETYWPYSITATPMRIHQLNRIIVKYKPWFTFIQEIPIPINNGPIDEDDVPIDVDDGPMDVDEGPMDIDEGPMDVDDGPIDEDDIPIPINNGPMNVHDGPMDVDEDPIDEDDDPMDEDFNPNNEPIHPWDDQEVVKLYPNFLKRHAGKFILLMFRALSKIEIYKNQEDELVLRELPYPIRNVPMQFLMLEFRATLDKGIRRENFPDFFLPKLSRKVKKIIENNLQTDEASLNITINSTLNKEFNRIDYDLPASPMVLSGADQVTIRNLIHAIIADIVANNFYPTIRYGVRDAKMSSLVPQHTLMRRHIPITRYMFWWLLRESGFVNLPFAEDFKTNDNLALPFYWNTFNFTRMKFDNMDQLRDNLNRFDFKIYSDGHAFTAQFTRPVFLAVAEPRPQDFHDPVNQLEGDKLIYVDPGKNNRFTAMQGISMPGVPIPGIPAYNPAPIFKYKEWETNLLPLFKLKDALVHSPLTDSNPLCSFVLPLLYPPGKIRGKTS